MQFMCTQVLIEYACMLIEIKHVTALKLAHTLFCACEN